MAFLLSTVSSYAQQTTVRDSTSTTFSFNNLLLPNPNSIVSKYTYDPITDRYIYTENLGRININYPLILTPEEFRRLVAQENMKSYYKDKIDAYDGRKTGLDDAQKNLIPELYVDSDFFESIFGGNTIEVIPQGSVEMDLGFLYTKQDNPSFSPRNRSNFTFDFDQRIELSLLGKIGTRLQVNANYDTQSTFDFQNVIKLEYTPTEDDIIQKIEVGNVSMPLNSSLITGAQSLFGVKTQLQFGKTTITGIFSEQKSESRTVVAQGGGTLQEFEFFALDYDENRHFFLSQYFRDNYDDALLTYPYVNSPVQITRIEVWVTNRNNQTDDVRNIVGLQDLGESDPTKIGSAVNILAAPGAYPDNSNNAYDPTNIGGAGSQITEAIRDIATSQAGILVPGVNQGMDFDKLENARKLQQGSEFTLHTQLGYISLNQRLQNDEILAVAFQFTVGDQVYQVGEFANDGVNATDVSVDGATGNTVVENKGLILKMLKSTVTNVDQPIWDLMMKNIYQVPSAFQLDREDFKLNIFYTETSPLNYITPVDGTPFPAPGPGEDALEETPLLRVFNLDKLNYNNDPQFNGDGFFDFVDGITVMQRNGKIIFTNVEPFGRYLFDVLDDDGNPTNNDADYNDPTQYNPNQEKYVYDKMYVSTKTAALEDGEKNKFQMKGRYNSSSGGGGIPLGAFNVPRGSVKVTAGGRVLVEGVDYTVNYQMGIVEILDPALQASNTPIQATVENNSVFGQQTRRFSGINIEHQFNENFLVGATMLNLNERPITQKATYNAEPINNTIFGVNANFSTEVPFFTRLVNKLPNIDTDVPSNFSVRGEFAYLLPGAPKGADFLGEATSYVDDFEGTQNNIDLLSPISWHLSSRPRELGRVYAEGPEDDNGIQNGFDRALLNWYTIDPIFYSSQRPTGISDNDMSNLYSRRIFIDEIFPQQDIVQGQPTIIPSLDLAYYPEERGPYNFDPDAADDVLDNPIDSWGGITRQLTSTDFEQANVEYVEFWLQDPYLDNTSSLGGKLTINLGNISEDVLKDGRKQYENGLPEDGNISMFPQTVWGGVVPQNQALIYAFSTLGQERENQDVGLDGYDDTEEASVFGGAFGADPAKDNYTYFLNTEGNLFERYKQYNGLEGNSPDTFTQTNRGSTTEPDVEDINRDNTMNTIDSYFEYELDITPTSLANLNNGLIRDRKEVNVTLPNGDTRLVRWYQFRIPLTAYTDAIGGISDFRSIRFIRMYLSEFTENTVMRFGSFDLVRSDWRRYQLSLDDEPNNDADGTDFSVGIIGILENDGRYVSPPGVVREQLNNNNTLVRQNEQSLVVNTCKLEPADSRAVFKNISVDMRQFKKLRMFIHAEDGTAVGLNDGDAVGFIRMGNDFTQNFYQIEIPLTVSPSLSTNEFDVWPTENEINLPVEVLAQIKAIGIQNGSLGNVDPTFYNVIDGVLDDTPVGEFSPRNIGEHRVSIKGNPNFGDIRTLMVGIKNPNGPSGGPDVCAEVWFNELRLSDMDNEGGWAAVASMDTNFADFMDISATGRRSTTGFGTIEQGPNERSREDIKQYDVVANVDFGKLLPQKWGVQIPFNYGQGEEIITPEYDQQYKDIKLNDRLNTATSQAERDAIKEQSEDYTKRQSINFIGVRKQRTGEAKPKFYDVENLTFNYSYNKVEHRDFEIENSLNQNVRVGANYNFSFDPIRVEPFKKNDSLFKSRYLKILKDFNFNLLPSSISINTDYVRQFHKQRFRELDLGGGNIGIDELFRRNYTFDLQYNINYNLTDALNLTYSASNNNIIRNYFIDDNLNGAQDPTLDVWDGFFDVGDPNRQFQQLGVNYEIPINKIPTFEFIRASYAYTGDFMWQKGSDLYGNLEIGGTTYNLGNSISNANTHTLNTSLDMNRLYSYLGLVKSGANNRARNTRGAPPGPNQNPNSSEAKKNGLLNAGIDILTSVKRLQINYTERNGTYLPGYIPTPGFIGTFKPTLGFTFGSQSDIRHLAARKGWLTVFPEFNQQFTQDQSKVLDFSASVEPAQDLIIDLTGGRNYSKNITESFNVSDLDNNGELDYNPLINNSFGNFNISMPIIKTAFMSSDENGSEAFDDFRANRLTIANRLATRAGIDINNPANLDAEGYPLGFGKTNQAVLLPAFLSAYTGKDAESAKLGAFRDIPIPNWTLKYTGLMRLKWFKKHFRRFSVTHGYNSTYTINQFRSNLDYNAFDPALDYAAQNPNTIDQAGNYKNETLFSAVSLTEMFSPLIKIDFEMKNSMKILAEIQKDRRLFLSFDNNLLTEIKGNEYIIGLGYRIKDVKIRSKLAGSRQIITSDLNMKADISIRDNKTIIRYLDLDNNQVTAGQTIWGLKYTADYAFSKNLTGIFYFDYSFSEYAISTAFPQTSIRSGITLRYNFGN
ncbi:cell surface protein SprA [Flavobacteriaceae sp. LMIT009]